MTTSRERVLQALSFQTPDRLPRDLGGMLSSSISAFAYPKLVAALGLPYRPPRVYDTYQMLAMPDLDVLDALDIDVVTVLGKLTNAYDQPENWHPYNYNGRLPALVSDPSAYSLEADGTIVRGETRMPPTSFVFDDLHGGQPFTLDDYPKWDLDNYRQYLSAQELKDEEIISLREVCRRTRESSDRAVFFNDGSIVADICIHGHGGIAVFPVICVTDPEYVAELHQIAMEHALKNIRLLLPEIHPYIDVVWLASDDWGTQNNTIASPKVFRDLFLPYRRQINEACHEIAPQVKTFLHSCGAIYKILDQIIESGFDILNPVQWPAGGHSYQEWKDKARKQITLWGGGVNAQHTLPLGSVQDVAREVREVTAYLGQDGGYVFCNIHNLLAEIPPEKVIAMYQAAGGLVD
jgi:uroporphyrinogen decarboxylase